MSRLFPTFCVEDYEGTSLIDLFQKETGRFILSRAVTPIYVSMIYSSLSMLSPPVRGPIHTALIEVRAEALLHTKEAVALL